MTTKPTNFLPDSHPTVATGKTGVLLVNLGTPQNCDTGSVRRYLRQFLNDRRVIQTNPVLWFILLNAVILTTRPAKTAKAYQTIWREDGTSPLIHHSRNQCRALEQSFAATHPWLVFDWAMRYGQPSIATVLNNLVEKGCRRILVLPLYPQYAEATVASVCDDVFRALMAMRWQPNLRIIPPYDSHPLYIQALANGLRQHLQQLDWQPEVIVTSYHGIPRSYFLKGDPYHCYCQKTTRLLKERLHAEGDSELANRIQLTFQSRFGRSPWLEPYTDETIVALAQKGIKNLVLLCPGFAADCLETLEEIAIAGHESFLESGGEHYSVVDCLNDHPDHIRLLSSLVTENLWQT